MVTIYLQTNSTEQIGIVEEGNRIKELIIDRPGVSNQVGNIYSAKVMKVDKGLQAAFVDIGQSKTGFLPVNEIPEARNGNNKSITSLLTEGQRIVVQIQKESYGTKGARLTANLTVPGTALVYMPYGNYVATSKKLAESERSELKQTINAMLEGQEGAIIRTAAKNHANEMIQKEFKQLRDKWQSIEQLSDKQSNPACIHEDKVIPNQLIRKFSPHDIDEVYIDQSNEAKRIRQTFPLIADKVDWEKKIGARLSLDINQVIRNVVQPTVKLATGMELVIDQTEALTVIDVDTAGYKGKWNKNQTIVHANHLAAVEAAHQIRLRNISGIIMIDFLKMKNDADKAKLINVFKRELAKDPIRTEVFGFTKLGLVEMTRKREFITMADLLLDSSKQKKQPFSISTIVFMLERELLEASNNQVEAIYLEMNPTIYHAFIEKIDMVQLNSAIQSEVFVKRTKGQASYQLKLVGSKALVNDYMRNNGEDTIDRLF